MNKENAYLKIPVIIPAYEPDEKLIGLLRQLREAQVENIILVNDGSRKDCAKLFEDAEEMYHCTILVHSVNLGKGRALKTAFNYCLCQYGDQPGCVTADSDGQHSKECIIKCMQALYEQPERLILGCRNFEEENIPFRSRFGNKCTCGMFRYLAGIRVSDTQTGLRAIPLSFMKELMNVKGERFEYETNMLMEAKRHDVKISEIPIKTIYIEENKTSHFHVIRDSARIYLIFAKFLFSSLSSSILDLLLFSMLCHFLRGNVWNGITYITAATVLARVISALYNYFLNYKVVFKSRSTVGKSGKRYFLLAIVQMGLSALLVNLLYPLFGGYEVFIKMPVDILLFFVSFVIQRELVYSDTAGSRIS